MTNLPSKDNHLSRKVILSNVRHTILTRVQRQNVTGTFIGSHFEADLWSDYQMTYIVEWISLLFCCLFFWFLKRYLPLDFCSNTICSSSRVSISSIQVHFQSAGQRLLPTLNTEHICYNLSLYLYFNLKNFFTASCGRSKQHLEPSPRGPHQPVVAQLCQSHTGRPLLISIWAH